MSNLGSHPTTSAHTLCDILEFLKKKKSNEVTGGGGREILSLVPCDNLSIHSHHDRFPSECDAVYSVVIKPHAPSPILNK